MTIDGAARIDKEVYDRQGQPTQTENDDPGS